MQISKWDIPYSSFCFLNSGWLRGSADSQLPSATILKILPTTCYWDSEEDRRVVSEDFL